MTEKIGVILDLMRLDGICKMLIASVPEDILINKYLSITKQSKVDNIKKAITKLSKSDLRKIIETSLEITEEVILQYYNEYRYGRKPGFVLYWANGFIGKNIDKNVIRTKFVEMLSAIHYNDDAKFKNLACIAVEDWNENGSAVLEIGLRYLKKYSYITLDNSFSYIHELTDCFAWLSAEKGFVALYNMPPTIEIIIKNIIYQLYGVKLLGLSLEKSMLDTIFDPNRRKKVSLTQHNAESEKPQKATFSDSHFADKQDAIFGEYSEYEVASSLYDEEIDDETIATLGVNSNRGKLYLNKNVTTTQFRSWSLKTITTIIDHFASIFLTDGTEKFKHIRLFSSTDWGRLTEPKRLMLNDLAKGILICKEKGLSQFPVDFSFVELYRQFPRELSYSFLLMCDHCNETTIPYCPYCEHSVFQLTDGLKCACCGKPISYLKCECNTTTAIDNIDRLISVVLKDEFLSKILVELQSIDPQITFAKNEFLTLHNGFVKLQNINGFKRLHPKNVITFKKLYDFNITEKQYTDITEMYKNLKEKCTKSTTDNCSACKYKNFTGLKDLKCLQQILCYFDDFFPSPHQGHEYGDLSISITVDGRVLNLQGIMKSDTNKITRSKKSGLEIINQVVKAIQDNKTEVIAVIAPTQFDAQLVETLLNLAKSFN